MRDGMERAAERRLQLALFDERVGRQSELFQAPAVPATRSFTDAEEVLTRTVLDLLGVVPPRPGTDLCRRQHARHRTHPRCTCLRSWWCGRRQRLTRVWSAGTGGY